MQKKLQPLTTFLQKHFELHLSRTNCLCRFIIALIQTKTINIVTISNAFISDAKPESCYKRLQRFLAKVSFDQRKLARTIISIIGLEEKDKWTLALDRTNWKFGILHINILYLAVCYKGVAFPIFFILLEDKKQGNSDFIDRVDLVDIFIDTFGVEKIEALLGDREFIGKDWIEYLKAKKIPYVMRVKENGQLMIDHRGRKRKIAKILRFLLQKQSVYLGIKKIGAKELETPISALRNERGDLVVLIHSEEIKNPIRLYSKRWQIETMFKAFKKNGFNLEDTHVTDPDRIMTLLSILSIAFVVVYKQGIIQIVETPKLLKRKKHGYFAKSIFRIGADYMQHLLLQIYQFGNEIRRWFQRILKPDKTFAIKGLEVAA